MQHPEQGRCSKCGTRTLERDGTDLHCWGCGHIIYYVFDEDSPPSEPSGKRHYRGRPSGIKRGHYSKVATLTLEVVRLYNEGCGIRPIVHQLGLAKNTVRAIIKENAVLVDHETAARRREALIKQRKQSIIPAIKGLASSAKRNGYSHEILLDRAEDMLAMYLEFYPQDTIKSLTGKDDCTRRDLIREARSVAVAQRRRLN